MRASRQLFKLSTVDVEMFAVEDKKTSKKVASRAISRAASDDSYTCSEASWSPGALITDDELSNSSSSSSPMIYPCTPADDAPPAYESCVPVGAPSCGTLSPLQNIPSLPVVEAPNALHLSTSADVMMYNNWEDPSVPQFIQPDVYYHHSAGIPSHFDDFGLHDPSFGLAECQDPYTDDNYLAVAWSATY